MRNPYYILILVAVILGACSTTKNIPEGKYLLDNMEVKTDNKVSSPTELESFVRQHPNGSLPLLGKARLKIYNMAGDTSKWLNRTIQKMGEAPVIYSESQTLTSANQLKKEMHNLGYLNAKVDTILNPKDKKISVTYDIKTGTPYRIRSYTNTIQDTTIHNILEKTHSKPLLNEGDLFDQENLEQERIRINNSLRNRGYYTFSKEYVYFKADTTLNSHQVDLFLDIYPPRDSIPYSQYKINNVTIISGYDYTTPMNRFLRRADTTEYKNMTIIRGRDQFLRSSSIARRNYLRKGWRYSDIAFSATYEAFSNLSAIRQTNITLTPVLTDSTNLLDATIILSPANAHWFRASLEGTNSAGDIGVAPSLAYQHQNIFNGGEQFSIKLKGAYEFVGGSKNTDLLNENYYEYGIDFGLTFPQFLFPWLKKSWRERPSATTKFSLGLTNQHRSQYTRQFFNATVNYGWTTNYGRIRYGLDLLDINYVRMPSVSDAFRENYLEGPNSNPLLRETYKDQLIARTALSFTLGSRSMFTRSPHSYTIRSTVEVAGALPRLVTALGGGSESETGFKKIVGVEYAEYVKGTFDYTRTFVFTKKHSLAYHIGIGLAYPYGNSTILPFERRFFSGGANSVRGWSTRSLGPGAFKRSNTSNDFVNQAGDIKLDMSIESRHKVSDLFEIAGFVDAGNIWTVHNYEGQPDGQFKFNKFYKEIAVAYGLGLRIDLEFLLLRFDTGIRAYDPGREQSKRFVLPALPRMAFHFGIGYPF
jgi:outer membrane protein assembly factor BamA